MHGGQAVGNGRPAKLKRETSRPLAILHRPIEELLVSGSDTRALLDPQTGLNRFGCKPLPCPDVFSFASSTATSISPRAFCRVEAERERLLELSSDANFLDEQTECQRHDLRQLLDLSHSGVDIVFSPSGTDTVLQALFLTRAMHKADPMDCILTASDETGSGVSHALAGQHFDTVTAGGVPVVKGEAITGVADGITRIDFPMRDTYGNRRSSDEMDHELFAAVWRSVASGHRVFLLVMDSSKLASRCPGMDCLLRLQDRFGDTLQIVVDACQMRCSSARLKWHLDQGHLVVISGSKFFTGPPFSGALLVPSSLSSLAEKITVATRGIQDYTNRYAWPLAWTRLRNALSDRPNIGQYFRWAAALDEMRSYAAVPREFRCRVLQAHAQMTAELIRCHPDLHLLEDWKPVDDQIDDAEMTHKTIFPFQLRERNAQEWMSFEDTATVYATLNRSMSHTPSSSLAQPDNSIDSMKCQIGQPVGIACGPERKVGALRVCASARTVYHLWHRSQQIPLSICLEQDHQAIATTLAKISHLSNSRRNPR